MKVRKPVMVMIMLLATVLMVMLAGCGGKQEGANVPDDQDPVEGENIPIQREPVTLMAFSGNAGTMNEENFNRFVKEPVSLKYPHITLNFMLTSQGNSIQDLITSGTIPDLAFNGPSALLSYAGLGLTEDMTPLVQKHQFDLNRIDQSVLGFIRNYSNNDGIYSIPYMNGTHVMFYNKEIFQKLGVDYPADRMTWDQTYDLARRITRVHEDVQYRGMEFFFSPYMAYNQRSETYLDPVTESSLFNTDGWKMLVDNIVRFYRIPGNEYKTNSYARQEEDFLGAQIVGMFVAPFNNPFAGISSNQELHDTFDWDIATMPYFEDKPNQITSPIPNHLLITKTSQHKDDAFLVVETFLSDEVQSMLSRGGMVPVLNDHQVRLDFLKDVSFASGKNAQAVFMMEQAPARIATPYDGVVQGAIYNAARDAASGLKDVNTALRDAVEDAYQRLAAEKAK